ncbi:MAG: phosphoserine transaminase, partial [Alphaproteobacteria bacterium]
MKPNIRPENPRFSSGPCTKRPGWTVEALNNALLGRSHRSGAGKARFAEAVKNTREILSLPEGYEIIITPAS